MPNAVTINKVLNGVTHRVVYMTLVSDGSEETDLVVYDSSAFQGTDTLTCRIDKIEYSFSAASTARAYLEFDASTDVLAFNILPGFAQKFDFRDIGGLQNYAGTGKTGDITLTTTGLESGDTMALVLVLRNV